MFFSRAGIFDLIKLQSAVSEIVNNIQTEDTINMTYDENTDTLTIETIEDKISQKITVIDGGNL